LVFFWVWWMRRWFRLAARPAVTAVSCNVDGNRCNPDGNNVHVYTRVAAAVKGTQTVHLNRETDNPGTSVSVQRTLRQKLDLNRATA
jgi:hypothetical protein